jgi:hypothetical protein
VLLSEGLLAQVRGARRSVICLGISFRKTLTSMAADSTDSA